MILKKTNRQNIQKEKDKRIVIPYCLKRSKISTENKLILLFWVMCPNPLTSLAWFQEMTSSGYVSPIARGLSWGHPCRWLGVSIALGFYLTLNVPLLQSKILLLKNCPHSLKYLKTYSLLVVLLEEVEECVGLEALLKEVRY